MAEAKGLSKPVKLKSELAEFLGKKNFPEQRSPKNYGTILKRINSRQRARMEKPENAGKYIVADAKLLAIFKNTKSKSKSGKLTDLTKLKEGQTINMMQMAAVVGANIE